MINSTLAVQGIKRMQDAFKVLAMLQMTASLWPQHANVKGLFSCLSIIINL